MGLGDVWITVSLALTLTPHVFGQLQLRVDPAFVFVDEDWRVGEPLPGLSICAQYEGRGPLAFVNTKGDPGRYFQSQRLNQTCWTLLLKKELDADYVSTDGTRGQAFHLVFKCTDGRYQAYANVDIQVMDLNDNAPEFVDTATSISVPETAEVGTAVHKLYTFDPDTGVGGLNSFQLEDSFENTFQLLNGSCGDSKCTADLFLMKKLNYDKKNVYTLKIQAFDGAGRIRRVNKADFMLIINVVDSQNNPPVWQSVKQTQYVQEDVPVGSRVFQIEALDGDIGVATPNRVVYKIVNEDARQFFTVDAISGWVSTKQLLNRESPAVMANNGAFLIQFIAEEVTAYPRPTSNLNVTVLVADVDDEPPRCNATLYYATVQENSQPLIPIQFQQSPVYVFDNDEGKNGEFMLELEGANGVFDVTPRIVYNQARPLIRVANASALDHEKQGSMKFTLWLKQTGAKGLTGKCEVQVTITDANDNPMVFAKKKFVAAIIENQPPGALITTIKATDPDDATYQPPRFSLAGQGAEKFLINGSGVVFSNAQLDRERQQLYSLTVVAVDDGGRGLRSSVPLDIRVVDENDEAPRFVQPVYTAYMLENSVQFSQLPNGLIVKATDGDEINTPNSNLTYEISGRGSEYFSINPRTGEIQIRPESIDAETLGKSNVLNFTATARDQGRPRQLSSSATVVITVKDINDQTPVFAQSFYNMTVSENAAPRTLVGRVTATDADVSTYNSLIAYRIATTQDKFVIDAQTGHIRVAEGTTLDRDTTSRDLYDLTVVALDQGIPQRNATTVVRISVSDINNKPPSFSQNIFYVNILEDAPVGTSLINLTAFDPDSSAKLRYRIVKYEKALSPEGLPVDPKLYNYTVMFSINDVTGEVRSTARLDRESLESVRIVVEVRDEASGSDGFNPQLATARVNVRILDVNDRPPVFEQPYYFVNLRENTRPGAVLLTIKAVDNDKASEVTYSMQPANGAERLLDIDPITGEVKVTKAVDFETTKLINATIIATDAGNPPRSANALLTATVIDENDNRPIFVPSSTYRASVSEGVPAGTVVLQVNATDPDITDKENIRYEIVQRGQPGPSFTIDATTGTIRTATVLDRESIAQHSITVTATDGEENGRAATAVVEITVLDVNDNPPAFIPSTPSILRLSENAQPNLVVQTFVALDADDAMQGNGVVRYVLRSGNATNTAKQPLFSINAQNGQLIQLSALKGMFGRYWVEIEARDLGMPEQRSTIKRVDIIIEDFNDNAPQIIHPRNGDIFSVPESEDLKEPYLITQLVAQDKDAGDNSAVQFSLKQTSSSNDWRAFQVDETTGSLYMQSTPDYEAQSRYSITLRACDRGSPPFCDEVEVSVQILDKNDNCPKFVRNLDYRHPMSVTENVATDTPIGEILPATDTDTHPDNRQICYRIVGGTGQFTFRLAAVNSSKLLVGRPVDRESTPMFDLILRAYDCRGDSFCTASSATSEEYDPVDFSMLSVAIDVKDVNDNPPRFIQRVFRGAARYDMQVDSQVGKITAVDPDTVDSTALRYFLLRPPRLPAALRVRDQPFRINARTGEVTLASRLLSDAPLETTRIELSVAVNDSLAQRDTAVLQIVLLTRMQQIELVFDSSMEQLWLQSGRIIEFLSVLTKSNASIDYVQADTSSAEAAASMTSDSNVALSPASFKPQSRVLVHFELPGGRGLLSAKEALRLLDVPTNPLERQARAALITDYGLRVAQSAVDGSDEDRTLYITLAAVIGGLLIVLLLIVALWCVQNKTYRRKLSAANSRYSPSSSAALYVPGTNRHAGPESNPVLSSNFYDNQAADYDAGSTASADWNSLAQDQVLDVARLPFSIPHRGTHSRPPSVTRPVPDGVQRSIRQAAVNEFPVPIPRQSRPRLEDLESTEL